jgi:transcription initiation factor TFIIF subunit alpha
MCTNTMADLPFPTIAEIRAVIPAEGITTAYLSQLFKHRTGERTKDFIQLVKVAGRYDTGLKKLFPQ